MAGRTLKIGRWLLSETLQHPHRLRHSWACFHNNHNAGKIGSQKFFSSVVENSRTSLTLASQNYTSRCNQSVRSIYNGTKRKPFTNTCITGAMSIKLSNTPGYLPLRKHSNLLVTPVSVGSVILLGSTTQTTRNIGHSKSDLSSMHNRISSLQAKKRVQRKKKQVPMESEEEWQVTAYATADEYDLNKLLDGLTHQGLYISAGINPGNTHNDILNAPPRVSSDNHVSSKNGHSTSSHSVPDASDVLHMVASYRVESENREIYFFREGSVVFWNVPEIERDNVLRFLKQYETGRYEDDAVEEECESLTYTYSEGASKTRLIRDKIILNAEGQTDLEKYTFSNAMAMSVKLGMWESSLDKYIEKIEYVSEELSKTGRVVLSQDQVLQKMGQLFALRHLINLSSDLLDTPDFYWDHAELEQLYQKMANHLSISKRTSVMNTKLSHCIELMELLKSHLNDKHSARLEWIIIILIMVEVGFELLHYAERLYEKESSDHS